MSLSEIWCRFLEICLSCLTCRYLLGFCLHASVGSGLSCLSRMNLTVYKHFLSVILLYSIKLFSVIDLFEMSQVISTKIQRVLY